MNSANSINAKNIINLKNSTPCSDSNLKKLCSEYSDILPCCDDVTPRVKRFRDRGKILWGKADCVDLFESKDELLKTNYFKFKTASWCMFPVLKKGDILKITSAKIDDIKISDIPVYRSQDKLYAHRVVDKQVIDGKKFIITRSDGSGGLGSNKNGDKVSEENILGKIEEVKRGRKLFSTKRREATVWDNFLYKKTITSLKLIALLKEILETILIKIQSFNFYEVFAKKLALRMKPHFNFELAIPFANERLNRLYNYIPLKDNKRIDFSMLKEAKNFRLVMKSNNRPIGCVSFLNRPGSCPYKGFWVGDFYIRLRYRRLGFDLILLRKAEDILKKEGVDNVREFLPDESGLAKRSIHGIISARYFLKNTEELLLICARKDLNERLKKKAVDLIKEGLQWEGFCESIMRSGATILAYNVLKAIAPYVRIPQFVFDRLKPGYIFIVSKSTCQHRELIELLKLFAQKDIPVLPLKGTLLSKRLYDDIAARGLSVDFDFLIKEKNKERIAALLKDIGYSFNPDSEVKSRQWQYLFSKPKAAMIDLHWDITMMGRSYERIEGLWRGTRLVEEDGMYYCEFKEEELLLYLSVHLVSSSCFRQLRYVCDINELLPKYKDILDWNSLLEKAKIWNVPSSLYTSLALSRNLFGTEIPPEVLDKLRPNLLKFIFIKIFVNKKVILRNCLRRRFINGFLSYIFFELIEAQSVKEYSAIFKKVFFPSKEVMGKRNYIIRILKKMEEIFKVLKTK